MSSITVIGGGYVGLISSACFTRLGHRVFCLEIDAPRLQALREARLPIREPGLPEIWEQGIESGLLEVTGSYKEAVRRSDFVFIAVGTPPKASGAADLRQVISAVRSTVQAVNGGAMPVIALKSTVPPGTAEVVKNLVAEYRPFESPKVVSNPEFLREGLAVIDFMRPSRVVLGADDPRDSRDGRRALRKAAPADDLHQQPRRRDDQVRLQRIPRHQDQLHERDRRASAKRSASTWWT